MAKLSSCYTLCPLIEKGLIGLSEDSSPGYLIVTLGKNMVIRYKLSDQNQVGSWSSRDRLTGPVIYDSIKKRYIAVFNHSLLREWTEQESDLNSVKKIKFAQPIHLILQGSLTSESVVIFKNGAVCLLSKAISSYKGLFKATLTKDLQIESCWLLTIEGEDCVGIVASKGQEKSIFQLISVETGKVLWRISILKNDDKKLLSKCIVKKDEGTSLLTLWSDGQLWSLPLKLTAPEDKTMGTQLYVINNTVSTKHQIAMTQLSSNHIALYGAEPNEEGAALAVLNLKFLLIQGRQHFKMFSAGIPQLWVQQENLFLIIGSLLTVVPFSLETEQLSALVGSLRTKPSNPKADERDFVAELRTMVWSKKKRKDPSSDNSNMPENIKMVAEQGLSQSLLCEATLPSILNSRRMEDLVWVIRNFSDLPEMELVRLLLFCLEEPTKTFKSLPEADEETNLEKIDYDALCTDDDGKSSAWIPGRWKFLHLLLSVRFTDLVIVPYLRGGLSLELCLELINRILRLTVALQSVDEIRTMLQWIAVLLDSHHQQIVLAGRHGVGTSLSLVRDFVMNKVAHETLKNSGEDTIEHVSHAIYFCWQMEYMADLRSLHPLLEQLVHKNLRKSVKPLANTFYSVEPLSLY